MRILSRAVVGLGVWVLAAGVAAAQQPTDAEVPTRETQAEEPPGQGVPAPGNSERLTPASDGPRVSGALEIDPAEVVVGMFYNGATVHASAIVPEGTPVAMLCRGEEQTLSMKKKGRALGVLWMNTGDIEFRDVPSVYMLRTSGPLGGMAPEPVLLDLDLGFDALASKSMPEDRDPNLFTELVRLREKEQLWNLDEDGVRITHADRTAASLATADFALPPKVPPGRYDILVYAFDGVRPALVGEETLTVRQAGVTATITKLAREHGLLYGLLAVAVAIVVGLLTGMVFGIGSKGAH